MNEMNRLGKLCPQIFELFFSIGKNLNAVVNRQHRS